MILFEARKLGIMTVFSVAKVLTTNISFFRNDRDRYLCGKNDGGGCVIAIKRELNPYQLPHYL